MKYEVVEPHAPEPGEPLVVSKGERLRWERRPTEWDGWLFCETSSGVRGWVPESWLMLDGPEAEILRDYDATELTVKVGDVLEGDVIESNWLRARDPSGRAGWVPLDCLTPPRES